MAKQSIVGIVFLLIFASLTMAIDVCPSSKISYDFKVNTFNMATLVLNNVSVVAQTRGDLVISLDRQFEMTGSASSYDYDGNILTFSCDNSFSSCWFESPANIGDMTSGIIKINSVESPHILYSRFYVEDEDRFYCYWRTDLYGDAKTLSTTPFCDDNTVLKRVKFIKFAFVDEEPRINYDTLIKSIDIDFPNEKLEYTGNLNIGDTYTVQIDGVGVETFRVIDCVKKNTTVSALTTSNDSTPASSSGLFGDEDESTGSSTTMWVFTIIFGLIILLVIIFGVKDYLNR